MERVSERNTLAYEAELCNGCGMCIDVCPHAVFAMNGRRVLMANPDDCMECGACQVNCPTNALVVDYGVGCAALMIRQDREGRQSPECGGNTAPQQNDGCG